MHDPTTLNRQGNDVGTQYRSVIFYHNDTQQQQATERMQHLDASGVFENPVVTEIAPAVTFYPAEAYHQDYFNNNTHQPYCSVVIAPKVEKFLQTFTERL